MTLRKNVYLCGACGAGWVSADIDKGVTPFMDACPFCDAFAGKSLMYNIPQEILADIPARVEWYKPTAPEIAAMSESMQMHVRRGGLRKRLGNRPPAEKGEGR